MLKKYQEAISIIKSGGIVVMPTDTIYGIIADPLNKSAVNRVYELKNRSKKVPLLIQIGNISMNENIITGFDNYNKEEIMKLYNQEPTTIIFEGVSDKFRHIASEDLSLGIRIPQHKSVYTEFLSKVGMVLSTSANISGQPSSNNIKEAKEYFKNKVDYYVDGGNIKSKASRVVKINLNGKITKVIRS